MLFEGTSARKHKIDKELPYLVMTNSVATVQLGSAWLDFADFGPCAAHGVEPSHQGTGWLVLTPTVVRLSHGLLIIIHI